MLARHERTLKGGCEVIWNPFVAARIIARYCYGGGLVVVAASSLFLSGCAPISPNAKYLFAPEVRTCPPTLSTDANGKSQYSSDSYCWARIDEPRPAPATEGQGSSRTVSQATNYARQIEEEYLGAKSEYGSMSSATGLLLIPAGASALALGAEGGASAAVSGLGFGSAGVLGLGYWLSNTKREKVYMTGTDALECLIGTMQPFDVEQTDFAKLSSRRDEMLEANTKAASRASYLEERLTRVRSNPLVVKNPCAKPVLCYAEQALKAAKSTSAAESKAYDAALQYQNFSEEDAGNEMIRVVNSINSKVNQVMTDTEPDLHSLANSLSSFIPQSADSLAGISSASSATSAAAALAQKTEIAQPAADKAAGGPRGGGGPGGGACKGSNPFAIGSPTRDELDELLKQSEELQWKNVLLVGQTETVVDLTPGDTKPKTENCTKLFDQPGVAPAMMTLNPDGYPALTQGDKLVIAISGGQSPFAVRLMCDCYDSGITVETKYSSGKGTIEISASGSAKAASYPVMVSDSTGMSRVVMVVVTKKADDSADTPDCTSAGSEQTASASTAEVSTMAQLAASAHAYAAAAAKAAKDATKAADTAERSHKSADANAATKAAARAYGAAANAQSKAAEADTKAGLSNDPIIQSLRQAADGQSQSANNSSSEAAAAAARAWAAVPKG
jgi:hypothetical protein